METRCLQCFEQYDEQYGVCPYCGFVRGTPPKEAYHLHPGVILNNRYVIGTVIRYGGFGVVYNAWDQKLEIIVAVKEYFPAATVTRTPGTKAIILSGGRGKLNEYKQGISLFMEEAKNTAKFEKHPNITNVYDYFEENNTAYMVMEKLNGINLNEYLKLQPEGRLSVEETIHILLSIINALKEVHKRGLLHRDIAPDNIFICSNNTVKLIDFGTAKFGNDELELTREVVVKPGYSPPEQYDSKSVQAAFTDIYALAATMYRAITGIVPDESVNRKEEDTLKSPKEVVQDIPDFIDSSLMRAMSITPEFRFKTVQEFEDAILSKKTFRSEQQQRKFLLRRRLICVSMVLLAIAITGGVNYRNYRNKKMAAILEPATIMVWMPVDEDGKDVAVEEFDGITKEFKKEYQQVKIEVEYIPEEEYQSRLQEAFEKKEAPTVFDGEYVTKDMKDDLASLKDVINIVEKKEYYFLDDYKTIYPQQDVLPTGFSVPVVYGNINLMSRGKVNRSNDLKKFLEKKNVLYIAGSDSYRSIQEQLPGIYAVMPIQDIELTGYFTDQWCVSSQGSDEQIFAGKRLLFYFLGEQAQDAMYIQHKEGLPLNKAMLDVYQNVNGELYFLSDVIERVTFHAQNELDMEKYYNKLFQEHYAGNKEMLEKLVSWLEEGEE